LLGRRIHRQSLYLPESIQDWSVLSYTRLIVSGYLIGLGTTMGNGCTSGHGICGIAAQRYRSVVATATFMLVGFVTAIVSNTYSYLPVFKNTLPWRSSLMISAVCIVTAVLTYAVAYYFNARTELRQGSKTLKFLTCFAELIYGVLFSLG
jgi:uncharacterized membrane protein YedE/YeeE